MSRIFVDNPTKSYNFVIYIVNVFSPVKFIISHYSKIFTMLTFCYFITINSVFFQIFLVPDFFSVCCRNPTWSWYQILSMCHGHQQWYDRTEIRGTLVGRWWSRCLKLHDSLITVCKQVSHASPTTVHLGLIGRLASQILCLPPPIVVHSQV